MELFLLTLLVIANGFFSMAEFAVISSKATRLHELQDAGHPEAGRVLELLDNPGKFLSAIQVGITLVSTLAGAFSGLAFSAPVAEAIALIPPLAPWSQQIAIACVVLGVTYFTLVVGELGPKKIALQHPERIALKLAAPLHLLSNLGSLPVALINGSTNLLLRMVGIGNTEKPLVSDEDVMLLIRQGAKKGIFESVEYEMVSRIFRLSDKQASSIMTPKAEIEWLDLEKNDAELLEKLRQSGRSRFPVAENNLDNILGTIRSVDLVRGQLNNPGSLKEGIRSAMKHPLFVPESVPAFQVLELFRKNRAHMALVVDEHGSVQGAITLTDVLESIVGDVPADDLEGEEKRIIRRSQRTWIIDGLLPVDEFLSAFELEADELHEEKEPRYDTMGGFIMTRLGEVPSVADTVGVNGISFRVIKMNGQRVGRILVELDEKSAARITQKEEER